MTFGKATALTAGLVGAMAFGVWVGPHLTNRVDTIGDKTGTHVAQPAPASAEATKAPAAPRPRSPAARSETPATAAKTTTVALSEPSLHKRLKPLLKPGAD